MQIMISNGRLLTDDPHLAGQTWERASWLVPFPCRRDWLPKVHEWARRFRRKWPFWWVYPVRRNRFGRYSRPILVRGTGIVLLRQEMIATEGFSKAYDHRHQDGTPQALG
jgi:hypothetical protein